MHKVNFLRTFFDDISIFLCNFEAVKPKFN